MEKDIFEKIIQFEENELNDEDTILLFQELKDTGLIWHLQGFYQRLLKFFEDANLIK